MNYTVLDKINENQITTQVQIELRQRDRNFQEVGLLGVNLEGLDLSQIDLKEVKLSNGKLIKVLLIFFIYIVVLGYSYSKCV